MTTPTDPEDLRQQFMQSDLLSVKLRRELCALLNTEPTRDELHRAILREAQAFCWRHGGDPDWLANEWMKEPEGAL